MKHDHSKRAKTRMAKLQLDLVLIGWQGGAGDFFKPTTAWAEAESKETVPDILKVLEVKPVHTLNRVYKNTQHKDVSQTFLLPSCWLKEFSMKVQKTTFFAQSLSEIKNNSYYRNKVKPVMLSL